MTDGDSDAGDAREESPRADMAGNPDTPADGSVTQSPETDTPTRQDDPAGQEQSAGQDDPTGQEESVGQEAPAGNDAGAADAAPDTATRPEQVPERVTVRQGGFWSMLAGGIVAAGIGVFAAPYVLPPDWFAPQGAGETQLIERIAKLEEQFATLAAPTDLRGEIDGLRQTLTGQLADLEGRVNDLAARPVPQDPSGAVPDEVIAALQDRLARQQGVIDELRDRFEARESAARDSARAMLRRAALTRIGTALDSGEAFAPALADLRETGVAVPAALTAVAGTGVPTHAGLVDSFPEAARAALATARNETDEGVSMTDFLRAQLGMRSLSPREGDDPDAVLSRAEAALVQGRLSDALTEIGALPESARAAMSQWAAQAGRRVEALAAFESLSQAFN